MDLYIANATKQHHDFAYKRLETDKIVTLKIRAGQQACVGKNLSLDEFEHIVKQYAPYGLVAAKDIKRSVAFTGWCYAERPIQLDLIMHGIEHNMEAIDAANDERRKIMAAAIDGKLSEQPEYRGGVQVETQQVTDGHKVDESAVRETMQVDTPNRRGRGRPSGKR